MAGILADCIFLPRYHEIQYLYPAGAPRAQYLWASTEPSEKMLILLKFHQWGGGEEGRGGADDRILDSRF